MLMVELPWLFSSSASKRLLMDLLSAAEAKRPTEWPKLYSRSRRSACIGLSWDCWWSAQKVSAVKAALSSGVA